MIREDRFLISRRPYAVDLSSLRPTYVGIYDGWFKVDAVWFRRRRGGLVACVGNLHTTQDPAPKTAVEFLERFTDGKHGGDCEGRWDGENYWGAQRPDAIAEHLALLKPMLANYPALPEGWDGWWRF